MLEGVNITGITCSGSTEEYPSSRGISTEKYGCIGTPGAKCQAFAERFWYSDTDRGCPRWLVAPPNSKTKPRQ